jgi:F420-non-reducing hydrogenase large subunit
MTERITISPITRLEGHGTIDIFLDDTGNVADAVFQVVELRGFESFCVGRPVEELIRIMPKICGVCPGAHHMAAAKAADAVYGLTPPPTARKLRELYLAAHIAHSHFLHFFALAAPDLILGPDADPARRNLLGVIEAVGEDFGRQAIRVRGFAQRIQGLIAGHPIHPVAALPGGMAKPLAESERDEIETMAQAMVELAVQTLRLFEERVVAQPATAELITGDLYSHETYYAGLVDGAGKVSFYDGKVRVVDPSGAEVACFEPAAYQEHIAERVEEWSYLKFPYLKAVGWKGLTDGPTSGVYRVNSLARLNVANGMATPLAQEAYERFYAFFGGKPVHRTMAFHWARLIEALFVCEETLRLARDPEITGRDIRDLPGGVPREGVGIVEAARGTLIHHYVCDPKGIATSVNLIVATVQNNAAISMSVKKAAAQLIHNGVVDQGILDRVEMAFRAYDPCLACATHTLPGTMPLRLRVHRAGGHIEELCRERPSR